MEYTCGIFDQVSAVGIQLGQSRPEMVVDRGTLEDALLAAFPFPALEIFDLQNNRQVLYQEYATQNRDQEFLVDDDGKYGNDTADCQASCIAHEYLGREGIVP